MSGEINYDGLKLYLDVIQTLALLALFAFQITTRRARENTTVITQQGGRLGEIEKDIVEIETILKHAPDQDDYEKLHARISDVRREIGSVSDTVSNMSGQVGAIDASVKLLIEHHVGKNR